MKNLIIIGAGGFGREVSWLIERINSVSPEYNLLGFLDDNDDIQSKIIDGYKVIGKISDAKNFPEAYFVCCIANTQVRKHITSQLSDMNFETLIDPAAIISPKVKIGKGCVICAGVVITVDISIGEHCIIDVNSTIGHDATLNDWVTLYPGVNVSGNTLVGSGVQLGTGCQVLQSISVGENTFVGAGAVVNRNLPDCCTAVGVPAKVIKINEKTC